MLVMPLLAMPRLPSEVDEDELDELPPIDGDGGDDPETDADLEGVGGPEPSDAGAASALDDSTGEDDPLDAGILEGLDGDEGEGGWLDEAVDSPDLDLGDAALIDAAVMKSWPSKTARSPSRRTRISGSARGQSAPAWIWPRKGRSTPTRSCATRTCPPWTPMTRPKKRAKRRRWPAR